MDESKSQPGDVAPEATRNPAATDETPQDVPTIRLAPTVTPPAERDEDAEKAARLQPTVHEGSGQWAVWDQELGQYVSGVGDKSTASAAKKALEAHNGIATDGHTLQVLEV